ncbi:MAG: hypothetical protein LAO19_00010 [Acidobacteriia bacterium]|nr:hypothetical protein [Terriglobia bacterium]
MEEHGNHRIHTIFFILFLCLPALNGCGLASASKTFAGKPSPAAAICYATNKGNDKNDGLSWGTSKFDVLACLDSLPQGPEIGSATGTIYFTDQTKIGPTGKECLCIAGFGDVNGRYSSISSITRVKNTVTASIVQGHAYTAGRVVTVSRVDDPSFDGTFTVTETTPTTVSWSQEGPDASSKTGHVLPKGFWYSSAITLQGVGSGTQQQQFANGGPTPMLIGGSEPDHIPWMWFAGNSISASVQNATSGAVFRGVEIGRDSNGDLTNAGSVSLRFSNVNIGVYPSPDNGPCFFIGANVYWLWIEHSTCATNTSAPQQSDQRAAVVWDANGNNGGGPVNISDMNIAGAGGLKIHAEHMGTNWLIQLKNIFVDDDGVTLAAPLLWITGRVNGAGKVVADGLNASDAPIGSMPLVDIDPSSDGSQILLSNLFPSNSPAIQGPATSIGGVGVGNTAPELQKQVGIFTSSLDPFSGRFVGNYEGLNRAFSPTAVRFQNVVPQDQSLWTVKNGIVSGGILAPDGTSKAVRISTSSGVSDITAALYKVTPQVGDWVVMGGWFKADDAANGLPNSLLQVIWSNNQGLPSISLTAPYKSDGNWIWMHGAMKVTAVPGVWAYLIYNLSGVDSAHPLDVYMPTMLYIPSGTLSDSEVMELETTFASYSDQCPVATVCSSGPLAFGGSGDNFTATLDHSNLTVNQTYVLPDVSGHLALLESPQTWTAPQTFDNPVLNDPTIDGEKMKSVPRSVYSVVFAGPLTSQYTAATFTLDDPIVVERLELTVKTPPQGCSTDAIVRMAGSKTYDMVVSSGYVDSGPTDFDLDSTTPVQVILQAPSQGCSISPADVNMFIRYRPQ